MSFAETGRTGPIYSPCHYGRSKVTFRGPMVPTDGRYAVFLGGNETYGRFLREPFPALIGAAGQVPAVNLGCGNAGLDVYIKDASLLGIVEGAETAVLQIVGAQNLSNRFYVVHPRRNDRFVRASKTLKAIYHDIDFTDFHFTRHMLGSLLARSPERFELVRDELRTAWVARMRTLISHVRGKAILLWLADRAPDDDCGEMSAGDDPLLVNRDMLDALGDTGAELVEYVATPAEIASGREAMVFAPLEEAAAREMLGPRVHRGVAQRLLPLVSPDSEMGMETKRPA